MDAQASFTSILSYSNVRQWNFVRGVDNPADYASRNLTPLEFWLNGPLFLRSTLKSTETTEFTSTPKDCELNMVHNSCLTTASGPLHLLLRRYSSWCRLWRAFVRLKRFRTCLFVMCGTKFNTSVRIGPINLRELDEATRDIILLLQSEAFSAEIEYLKTSGKCKSLAKLNPFQHNDILMLGGRVENAETHRPILPHKHTVTELIIQNYHQEEGHAGLQQVLSTVRKHF